MNPTAQITPPRTPSGPKEPTDARCSARAPASERPVPGEMLAEIVPLVLVIPGYGPPAVFVLGPWLFLGLIVGGPLAWLFALVVVMIVAATVLAALAAAMLTAPYLLVRHLRRRRARHASISAPAAQVVAIESPRVVT
jgi:hypothetical protein